MSINVSVLNKIDANKIQEHIVEVTGNWLPRWNGRVLEHLHTTMWHEYMEMQKSCDHF